MILMDDIIREGHPTLNKKAKDVPEILSINDKKLAKEMLEFVLNSQDHEIATKYDLRPAVGIAAPQLGIEKRIFVISVVDFDNVLYEYILLNPTMEIIDDSLIYLPGGEGCLSVDRVTEGLTPRYNKVKFKALRYEPNADIVVPVEITVSGYIGIVFQHEYDHLEGVLFTEKLFDKIDGAKPAFEIISD